MTKNAWTGRSSFYTLEFRHVRPQGLAAIVREGSSRRCLFYSLRQYPLVKSVKTRLENDMLLSTFIPGLISPDRGLGQSTME